MKKILFIFCSLLIIFLIGCSSVNTVDEETYEALKSGIEMFDNDLQKYWKYDITLSERDRNTKKIKLKNMKKVFELLKVKK